MADALSRQGQSFLGGLTNQSLPGSAQAGFMGPGFAQEQINALGANLNRNLNLGLNSIQNRFGLAGTMGSRAGATAGTALGDTQLAFGSGVASILQGDRLARQQAAQGVDQYNLGGGALSNQANLGGLSALPGLFNLGMAGYQNAWSPLGNYQAAVGGPIILGQGSSSNSTGILNSVGGFMNNSGLNFSSPFGGLFS